MKFPAVLLLFISISLRAQHNIETLLEVSVVPTNYPQEGFTSGFKELLKKDLENVRVVSLGEASHEDGETFRYKTALVKFLHEEMGFNVLAFEYGFYGNWKAGQELITGEDVRRATWYGGWANSKYAYPVYEYMAQTHVSGNSLYYTGFDGEKVPDGTPNIKTLLKEIKALSNYTQSERDSLILDSLISALYIGLGNAYHKNITYKARKRGREIVEELQYQFKMHRNSTAETRSNKKLMVYSLALRSVLMDEKSSFAGAYWNIIRDKHMAIRTTWLTDSLYPGEKLILWGASAHFARNMVNIDRKDRPGTYGYYPYYQMGDWLNKFYGDQFYSIVFTTSTGQNGLLFPEGHRLKQYEGTRDITPPLKKSFEQIAGSSGKASLFCSLRQSGTNPWINEDFTAYIFGYQQDHALWSEIIDAIFYVHEMKPDVRIR